MITISNNNTSILVDADIIDCGTRKVFFPHKTKYQLFDAGINVNTVKTITLDDQAYTVLSYHEIKSIRTNYGFFIASSVEVEIRLNYTLVEYTKDNNSQYISVPRTETMTTFKCGNYQIFLFDSTKAKLTQAKFKLGPASKFITEFGTFIFDDLIYTINPKYPVVKTRKI